MVVIVLLTVSIIKLLNSKMIWSWIINIIIIITGRNQDNFNVSQCIFLFNVLLMMQEETTFKQHLLIDSKIAKMPRMLKQFVDLISRQANLTPFAFAVPCYLVFSFFCNAGDRFWIRRLCNSLESKFWKITS